jgi:hypothetical protein
MLSRLYRKINTFRSDVPTYVIFAVVRKYFEGEKKLRIFCIGSFWRNNTQGFVALHHILSRGDPTWHANQQPLIEMKLIREWNANNEAKRPLWLYTKLIKLSHFFDFERKNCDETHAN